MRSRRGVLSVFLALACTALPAMAQEDAGDYFRAVAEFFDLPLDEVEILREWRLDVEAIPVVLFVAGRTGVSAEALAQLRRSGRGWSELASRYGLDASHFHLPLAATANAHALAAAYERFRNLPAARWREVSLTDSDIVILVNVRMIAQTLRKAPEEVLARHASAPSFVELYRQLIRNPA